MDLLYKYVSAERALTCLPEIGDGTLRATQPSALNDPFECAVYKLFVERDEEEGNRRLSEVLTSINPSSPVSEDRVVEARDRFGSLYLRELLSEQLSQRFGIVSFATDPRNPLMWSHYTIDGSGFALGYDADLLRVNIRSCGNWDVGMRGGVPFQVEENVHRDEKLEGYAMSGGYQNREQMAEVEETLESMVTEGARRMLASALEEEVEAFLGRGRYQRGREFRGYRNGYHRSRPLTVGLTPVEVKVPRVSDVPKEVSSQGYRSQIVRRYERSSRRTQELYRRLYLEGLSTGDFEPVFRELVGETTALSANAIVRLKQHWEEEYERWGTRRLERFRYAYIWADGVYLGAGGDEEKTALLCVVGAREDGVKELLGMELGYRESTESWAGVLRGLRERGLEAPLLAVGDGALGLWAALDQVFPTTEHQRCWNHRVLNVQAKLPKALHTQARRRLRDMSRAESRARCEQLRDEYVSELRLEGRDDAADTVLRDWEEFVSFYRYPMEHWLHLRTTNPLESVFSAVRLRTDVTRRMQRRDSALYLVFKVVLRLSERWRQLNGGMNLMGLVLDGARFQDGVLVQLPARDMEAVAA